MQVAMNLQFCCVTSCTKKVTYNSTQISRGVFAALIVARSKVLRNTWWVLIWGLIAQHHNLEAGCPGLIVRACGANCLESATLVAICDRNFLGVRNLFHSI